VVVPPILISTPHLVREMPQVLRSATPGEGCVERIPLASCYELTFFHCLRRILIKRKAEWGYVNVGSVLVPAFDENSDLQGDGLEIGDIWYFPKDAAHIIQGENAYYLKNIAFDKSPEVSRMRKVPACLRRW